MGHLMFIIIRIICPTVIVICLVITVTSKMSVIDSCCSCIKTDAHQKCNIMELGTPDNVLFKFSIFVIIWVHILVSEMGEK